MKIAILAFTVLAGCEFSGEVTPNLECTRTCDDDKDNCYQECETECVNAEDDGDTACDTDCRTVCEDDHDDCTVTCEGT